MEKYVLGIDQGTTCIKAMIFSKNLNVVGVARREFSQGYPKPGWVEHDLTEIWKITRAVIKEALKDANILSQDLAAIGIANQRDTTAFWYKKNGNPIGKAVVWQDRRSLPIVEKMIEHDKAGIESRTGMILIPNIAAAKIKWAIDNQKEVKAGIEKGEVVYGTIDSWLIWKLSGGRAHVTDYSNASVTALLNARTLAYDHDILNFLEIPVSILPEIRNSSEIYAYTDPAVFGATVPISGAVGDQQASMLGQGCIKKGMAKNTYGTGSFILYNSGNRHIQPLAGLFSPILWKIGQQVVYGVEGMADISGAGIQWLREGAGIIKKSSDAEALAKTVADTGGVYFVPAFVGLGSPYFDAYARGMIGGIHATTTREHIIRATLEAMAYQVKDAMLVMEKTCGRRLKKLRVDGGGSTSDFLMQFQADILGIPIERPKITETTCLGAAYLAGIAVGYWDNLDFILENWQLERCFMPKISSDQREFLYSGWQRALKTASNWLR